MTDNATTLITGAGGFLGQYVVAIAKDRCGNIETASRSHPGSWGVDFGVPAEIDEMVEKTRPQLVIHLAASGVMSAEPDLAKLLSINAAAMHSLLSSLAKWCPNSAVVLCGSGFEYEPGTTQLAEDARELPNSLYGISKLAGTHCARLFSETLRIAVARPFYFYGVGEPTHRLLPYAISQAKRGSPIELTPGEQVRDFLYVTDVAKALWEIGDWLKQSSKPGFSMFNVGSGEGVSLKSAFECMREVLQHDHGIEMVLRWGSKEYRTNEMMYYVADNTKIRSLVGWCQEVELKMGLSLLAKSILQG
jgi:nucleoside-diphosphate-sugar epimerase